MTECVQYPFPAITGHETAKKAILCALVNEDIRGVLIIGERGTAKSVLARSAATVLDEKKIRIIPQNTTEDRLFGSIDIEQAITKGEIGIFKGILAESNCQMIVAEDINLLGEKIVYGILNTSETGSVLIERDGFSQNTRTKYILAATMDPEEGGLPPQMLDRFDLCVSTDRIEDEEERIDIIKNHIRFERDPVSFFQQYEPELKEIKEQIRKARERLPYVSIPAALLDIISELCIELNVAGQRGDIALAKAAKTLAALDGRDDVVFDDIKQAALMALEHRRRETPPPAQDNPENDEPENEEDHEEDRSPDNNRQERPEEPEKDPGDNRQENEQEQENSDKQPDSLTTPPEQVFEVGTTFDVIDYLNEKSSKRAKNDKSGRRVSKISDDRTGHYISYRQPGRNKNDIAIDASLRAAAPFQKFRNKRGLAISVEKGDLREKVREKKTGNVILFLVDASGSMGARKRMVAVKGAILSLLNDAYQKRDMVGLMIFRKDEANLLLPPTRSTEIAYKKLKEMPTGGRTPLTKGIIEASRLLTQGRYSRSGDSKTVIILTDGRVNVSESGKNPYDELKETARTASGEQIRYLVVDTEEGFPRMGFAIDLAFELGATYLRLEDLDSRNLARSVEGIFQSQVLQ